MNQIGYKLIKEVEANRVSKVKQILRTHPYVINYKDNNGWTALIWASYNGFTECLKLLIQSGAKLDIQEKYGWTALMHGSFWGRIEDVRLLLQAGANTNIKTPDGWTALMATGRPECVRLLLQAGAKIDSQTKDGWTALMYVSRNGYEEMVKFLLQAGANPTIKNNNNKTAYDLATDKIIKRILKNAMKAYPVMSLLGSTFNKKSGVSIDLVRKMVQEYLFSKKINNKKSKKINNKKSKIKKKCL